MSFPVWLRNLLISAGLKPVLSPTENHVSYYYKLYTNIKISRLKPVLLACAFGISGHQNLFNSYDWHFYLRGKLYINDVKNNYYPPINIHWVFNIKKNFMSYNYCTMCVCLCFFSTQYVFEQGCQHPYKRLNNCLRTIK